MQTFNCISRIFLSSHPEKKVDCRLSFPNDTCKAMAGLSKKSSKGGFIHEKCKNK